MSDQGVPSRPRIDAHQHVWEVDSGRYTWPTPADGPLYRTFTPAELEPELAASGIDGTVLVQTVDTLWETDSMLAVADRYPWVRGVVGWVPLTDPRAAARALDERSDPRLRGIRHLIHQEADPDWLRRPEVLEGLRVVARRGLSFDVVAVFPNHLRLVPWLADQLPDLQLVIDHLAKPPFRADGWDRWSGELRRAAERPNVAAKVSGLDTAAGPGWTIDELRPAIEVALEAFGPDRLMFGSDWPVCRLVSDYGETVDIVTAATAGLRPDERAAVLGGTASAVYRLPDPR